MSQLEQDPMTTTALDALFQVEPPWIRVGSGEAERRKWIPSYFYSREGLDVCVRLLRGWKMRSVDALMSEFGAALQFFEGFGENWHALEECLTCLDEWLPADAYVLVVERAEELLAEEDESQLAALLKTLGGAGEAWSKSVEDNGRFNRSAIPFHVLLNLSNDRPAAQSRFAEVARDAGVTIEVVQAP